MNYAQFIAGVTVASAKNNEKKRLKHFVRWANDQILDAAEAGKFSILVGSDNKANLDILVRVLGNKGFIVREEGTGARISWKM